MIRCSKKYAANLLKNTHDVIKGYRQATPGCNELNENYWCIKLTKTSAKQFVDSIFFLAFATSDVVISFFNGKGYHQQNLIIRILIF